MKWRNIKIGELGRVVTGKTPPTAQRQFFDGEYPFITPSDLSYDGYQVFHTETTVSDEAKAKLPNQFIPPGSVTYTCIASVGKIGMTECESLTNQQINSIIPNRGHDGRFIYYLLRNETKRIQGLCSGVATPIINKSDFEKVEVRVPDSDSESRIASILSAYDDAIENNRRRMGLLEKAARLLYEEWFVRLRFPGHEHTPVKNGMPQGWDRKALKVICPDLRDAASPANLEPETPYIGLEHMPRRSITLRQWGTAEDVTSTKLRYQAGDILFGKIRSYFHKVGFTLTDGVASSDAIVLRPIDPLYYSFSLLTVSSDWFVTIVSKTAKEGSKMPRADWKLMEKHSLKVPPRAILESLNDSVLPILDQLRNLAIQNQKLRITRDLLLPRLMSGEIEV